MCQEFHLWVTGMNTIATFHQHKFTSARVNLVEDHLCIISLQNRYFQFKSPTDLFFTWTSSQDPPWQCCWRWRLYQTWTKCIRNECKMRVSVCWTSQSELKLHQLTLWWRSLGPRFSSTSPALLPTSLSPLPPFHGNWFSHSLSVKDAFRKHKYNNVCRQAYLSFFVDNGPL